MKLINKFKVLLVAAILASTFMVSCDSILDSVEPAASVSAEEVLNTEAGVIALRANMYSKMRASGGYTTQYFIGPAAFSDETINRPGATRYEGLNSAVGTSGTAHLGIWGASYNIIQNANLLIGAIPEGVLSDAQRDQFRAEAHAIRAFAMHNLARVYGYEPGRFDAGPEANWNLAAILRTEPVLDVSDADFRPRATVDDMYAAIFADLQSARDLFGALPASAQNADGRAGLDFARGLTARVHLYAGNWGQASEWAQTTINGTSRSLSDTEAGVAGMFRESGAGAGNHPEALFKLIVADDENIAGSNVNNGPAAYTSTQWVAQIPTQRLVDMYDDDDFRTGWYGDCAENQTQGAPVGQSCFQRNDKGWSILKFNGGKGNLSDDLPYMRLAEMYLIWAEAAAKAASDPNAGVAPLQTLLDARNAGTVPAEALNSIQDFESFILDERMRELAVEGHRFWDLKRTGRDILNAEGEIKIRPDSYRMLAPLGQGLLGTNELLVENPGY